MRAILVAAAMALGSVVGAAQAVVTPAFLESRGLADWDIEGNGTWAMQDGVLALTGAGVPEGPIRKPAAMAILKGEGVRDFTLEVDIRSTAPADLLVRDVLLIFGYQSPTRFYYVHLSARTDNVHNGIFVVNDADRRRLDQPSPVAPLTDQAWHRVRLVRSTTTGDVSVYFGSRPEPVLSVRDSTLVSGRVGVGSFDETAEFRNLVLTPSAR